MSQQQTHEHSAHEDVQIGPERGFGVVFSAVFTVIALWPVTRGQELRWSAFVVAVAFLVAGMWRPGLLRPLNRAWFKFGQLLSRFTTPIIMSILFLFVVLPTGIVMRLRRKDLLKLKFDRDARSYWIVREPPGPKPDTMQNQF